MRRAMTLTFSLVAACAAAQEVPAPEIADSFISVTDPLGGIPGPFYVVPQTREIFFGFDQESPDGVGIAKLSVLAEAARRSGAGSALIVGHADAVGDAEYNLALSLRRADTIRRELLSRGVPSEVIAVRAVGAADPAIPAAGREPANRRVVVTIADAGVYPGIDYDEPISFPLP